MDGLLQPVEEYLFALLLHVRRIEGGRAPEVGFVGCKFLYITLRSIPSQLDNPVCVEIQKGERLNPVKVVLPEKQIGLRPVKKIEQHKAAAAAVGRVVVVLYKRAVEQAGCSSAL